MANFSPITSSLISAYKQACMMNYQYKDFYGECESDVIKHLFREDGSSEFDFLPAYFNSATSLTYKNGDNYEKTFSFNLTHNFLEKWHLATIWKGNQNSFSKIKSVTVYTNDKDAEVAYEVPSSVVDKLSDAQRYISAESESRSNNIKMVVSFPISSYPTATNTEEMCVVVVPVSSNFNGSHTSTAVTSFTVNDGNDDLFTLYYNSSIVIDTNREVYTDQTYMLFSWFTKNASMYAITYDVYRLYSAFTKYSNKSIDTSPLAVGDNPFFINRIFYGFVPDNANILDGAFFVKKTNGFYPIRYTVADAPQKYLLYQNRASELVYGTSNCILYDYRLLQASNSHSSAVEYTGIALYHPRRARQDVFGIMLQTAFSSSTATPRYHDFEYAIACLIDNGTQSIDASKQPIINFRSKSQLSYATLTKATFQQVDYQLVSSSGGYIEYQRKNIGNIMMDLLTGQGHKVCKMKTNNYTYGCYSTLQFETFMETYFSDNGVLNPLSKFYSIKKTGVPSSVTIDFSDVLIAVGQQ